MTHFKDITGQRFGRLTAVERVGNDKRGRALWKCRCDCGCYKVTSLNSLRNGYLYRNKLEIDEIMFFI